MWVLLLSLVLLGIVCFVADKYMKRTGKETDALVNEEPVALAEEDTECCGQHEICEKDSLILMNDAIVYYDDEELDAYKGMDPEEYTDQIYNEFADVFYTMKEEEVAGWVRSLTIRGIALPNALKDEVLMVVRERRFANGAAQ